MPLPKLIDCNLRNWPLNIKVSNEISSLSIAGHLVLPLNTAAADETCQTSNENAKPTFGETSHKGLLVV